MTELKTLASINVRTPKDKYCQTAKIIFEVDKFETNAGR